MPKQFEELSVAPHRRLLIAEALDGKRTYAAGQLRGIVYVVDLESDTMVGAICGTWTRSGSELRNDSLRESDTVKWPRSAAKRAEAGSTVIRGE